jgi:hypothetical protein
MQDRVVVLAVAKVRRPWGRGRRRCRRGAGGNTQRRQYHPDGRQPAALLSVIRSHLHPFSLNSGRWRASPHDVTNQSQAPNVQGVFRPLRPIHHRQGKLLYFAGQFTWHSQPIWVL